MTLQEINDFIDKLLMYKVENIWGDKYTIERYYDTRPELDKFAPNQALVYGDGETYCFLLTEKI